MYSPNFLSAPVHDDIRARSKRAAHVYKKLIKKLISQEDKATLNNFRINH